MLWIAATLFAWSLARYLAGRYWPDDPTPAATDAGDVDDSPARPWTPPQLDTVVDLPDRGPVVGVEPSAPAADAEPTPVEPVDLVDPVRVDEVPPAECSSDQWWNDKKCWGCPRACTFNKWRKAQVIPGMGVDMYRGKVEGCKARCPSDRPASGGKRYPDPFKSWDAQLAREWDRLCQACGERFQGEQVASGPSVVDGLDVAVDGCPF